MPRNETRTPMRRDGMRMRIQDAYETRWDEDEDTGRVETRCYGWMCTIYLTMACLLDVVVVGLYNNATWVPSTYLLPTILILGVRGGGRGRGRVPNTYVPTYLHTHTHTYFCAQ
ncbi:uncharacterized protein GGS25DRAFT_505942 [Hypoxylon fragiforme]|uniref:uncharacterized protein n=1 Tax=Hypoxylon fragiforme TaxID=63214 RepID=UPI0020C65DD8|nr:uncharacterized protein GGS25DRAFT_505942 [Hypoxylon fragiforme]KAI2603875.1 hypothetical protein GGS25DRAFT_505942 [Hypoxylon fragiforme]